MSANQWAGIMRGDESYAGSPSLLPLPRLRARHHGLRAHHPDPPGPRRRAHPLPRDVQGGRRRPQQQPLRHHARQRRVPRRHRPGPALRRARGHGQRTTRSRATWTSRRLERGVRRVRRRPHPARHDDRHEQLRRRPARLAWRTREASPRSAASYGTPLYLDACRIAENAYFIKLREPGYAEQAVREIVREMCDLADGCTMSAKKDAIVNIGGFLATRDAALARRGEGPAHPHRGLPDLRRPRRPRPRGLAIGMQEAVDEDYLHYRIASTHYLGEHLREAGVPLLWPPGGHAIYLDAARFAPHLQPTSSRASPSPTRCTSVGGVRASRSARLMFGRRDPETGEETAGPRELVRLAIPRRDVHAEPHGLRHRGREPGVRAARVAARLPHRRAGAVPAALLGAARAGQCRSRSPKLRLFGADVVVRRIEWQTSHVQGRQQDHEAAARWQGGRTSPR